MSVIAESVKNPPAMQETWVDSGVWKIPWRRKWQPTPVFLPGKSHGQRRLVGNSPWGRKDSDMTERLTLSISSSWIIEVGPTYKQEKRQENGIREGDVVKEPELRVMWSHELRNVGSLFLPSFSCSVVSDSLRPHGL